LSGEKALGAVFSFIDEPKTMQYILHFVLRFKHALERFDLLRRVLYRCYNHVRCPATKTSKT